jgi:hypothetical protein
LNILQPLGGASMNYFKTGLFLVLATLGYKSSASDFGQHIHQQAITGNYQGLQSHLIFARAIKGFDAYNCLYQGQGPLHVVTTADCAKLLLKKANRSLLNTQEETPLTHQVSRLILLFDTENHQDSKKIEKQKSNRLQVIALIAAKAPLEEKMRANKIWKTLILIYKNKNRLKKPPPEGYSVMIQQTLGLTAHKV